MINWGDNPCWNTEASWDCGMCRVDLHHSHWLYSTVDHEFDSANFHTVCGRSVCGHRVCFTGAVVPGMRC